MFKWIEKGGGGRKEKNYLFFNPFPLTFERSALPPLLGSLSNDDDDVNENAKKAIDLDWQNNNSACASRFFEHFFAVIARLRRENAHFHVLWRT